MYRKRGRYLRNGRASDRFALVPLPLSNGKWGAIPPGSGSTPDYNKGCLRGERMVFCVGIGIYFLRIADNGLRYCR